MNIYTHDVNAMFNQFCNKLTEILDKHVPLKTLSKKQLSFSDKP